MTIVHFHGADPAAVFTPGSAKYDVSSLRAMVHAAAPCPVVADQAPDIRRAIQHLQVSRECESVSIEAGPSTARSLYERPRAVNELLLSVYLEPTLDERAQGAPLITLSEVRQLFRSETSATHRENGRHWSFHKLCR